MHIAVAHAEGNRASGIFVRRAEIETLLPIVHVHPTTNWKSVYVNLGKHVMGNFFFSSPPMTFSEGFTQRIVGVPKAESSIRCHLDVPLPSDKSENTDHQVCSTGDSIAFWDNRVSRPLPPKKRNFSSFIVLLLLLLLLFSDCHSFLTGKNQPPSKIMNVKQEKKAKDRQLEIWKPLWILRT